MSNRVRIRVLSRLRNQQVGHSRNDELLALNLSFVLHEPSTGHSVSQAIAACRTHWSTLQALRGLQVPVVSKSPARVPDVDCWLTASIGLPLQFINTVGSNVVVVDQNASCLSPAPFFRAPAILRLPDEQPRRVAVGALVLRPDRRSAHQHFAGEFAWPSDSEAALRAVERVIQAHVEQWLPPRALWPAPAEVILSNEVFQD